MDYIVERTMSISVIAKDNEESRKKLKFYSMTISAV